MRNAEHSSPNSYSFVEYYFFIVCAQLIGWRQATSVPYLKSRPQRYISSAQQQQQSPTVAGSPARSVFDQDGPREARSHPSSIYACTARSRRNQNKQVPPCLVPSVGDQYFAVAGDVDAVRPDQSVADYRTNVTADVGDDQPVTRRISHDERVRADERHVARIDDRCGSDRCTCA